MSEAYGDTGTGRSGRLDQILAELVGQVPEIEAASVVSFDGLAMAAALPPGMDEDRVAAMSAALLSLGERAAEGLGRGLLSQVFVEGENGTVFLVSADDEAVLVAVAAERAKTGLMLFEVRRAAAAVGEALKVELDYRGGDPADVQELSPVQELAPVREQAPVEELDLAGDVPTAGELAAVPLQVVGPPAGYDLPFDATGPAAPRHAGPAASSGSDASAWS